MRLSQKQRAVIKQAAIDCFSQRAVVRLFGSRLDDSKRGGDIDLLIETDISQPDELVKAKNRFLAQLYRELGEQKIDILVDYPNRENRPAIYSVAYEKGVAL
ncbi:nucleotidyltransferase domain-containing protein [Ectothiorhodospiraceae bacterium BW-2]|nr:nucleotidyltransferase domain-containing protein [Ectothiorhodospiraceae bacterium BW-2]QEP43558.1 nucleotidyltransferase domain-containing protein [Ectothiorhodospiraceae bacterium BW-2]